MSFSGRIETISGLLTGLLWIPYWLVFDLRIEGFSVEAFLSAFVILGVPGLLVAIGAYAHAVREKAWGRVTLTVGCSILILVFLFSFFGGIGYYGGVVILAVLAPSLTGIITVVASRANDANDY